MKNCFCKIGLFVIAYTLSYTSYAQRDLFNVDSLKKVLLSKKDDTVKVKMLYDYSASLYDKDISACIYYAKQGIQLARNINMPFFVCYGILNLSVYYANQNRQDSAVFILLDGLDIAERNHLEIAMPGFYHMLGESYRLLDNLKQAEDYDYKFLEKAKQIKNDTIILGALQSLIAVYDQENQNDKVDSLASVALPLASAQKDDYSFGRILGVQGKGYLTSNKFQQAIDNFKKVLPIWKKMDSPADEAYTQSLMSRAYTKMNNKDSAGHYANEALETAKKYKLKKETGDAYSALYGFYNHFGDYKKALDTKILLDSVMDEVNSIESAKTTLRAEMQYTQDKKDLQASLEKEKQDAAQRRTRNIQYSVIILFVLFAAFLLNNNRQKQRSKAKIEKAYSELKSTQAQLIQSEKMASLGELTAGIAHEIQNPLNFVNNFSEVNKELIEELRIKNAKLKIEDDEINDLLNDLADNEEKINHHGKRADAIVRGMLQHSKKTSGQKEPTDINALADEYLRLSFHGMRAKDKDFNATINTDFDESIGLINIIPQDISRVLLNLYNNAFYAVNEKQKTYKVSKDLIGLEAYTPTVSVSTRKTENSVTVTVSDNGNGIPQSIVDKIFQPFFTTKPTGQGTGLGLSLSYDIVKAHGGEIKVESKEGKGTEFIIKLPITA